MACFFKRSSLEWICWSMMRIKHYEFWNTHLFHFPIYLYWLYLSIKARSLFFFSAANPGIETGGLMGESKYKILNSINSRYIPHTLFYETIPGLEKVLFDIKNKDIQFPFVVKPDIGQGGWLIDMIHDVHSLELFLARIKMPFMIQQYVEDPIELGVLYYRFPGAKTGTISSVAIKELLSITGDGTHSIRWLMQKHPRAKRQLIRLSSGNKIDLERIPAFGEKVSLSFVGNHSYGTTFRNGNHIIDDQLSATFDELCSSIDGFYFGRFDIRCKSIEHLKAGDFKILELNGVGSEPLHIFDPREKIWNAYSSAMNHWKIIYEISQQNKKSIAPYMKLKEAWDTYKHVLKIQRLHQTNFTIGN